MTEPKSGEEHLKEVTLSRTFIRCTCGEDVETDGFYHGEGRCVCGIAWRYDDGKVVPSNKCHQWDGDEVCAQDAVYKPKKERRSRHDYQPHEWYCSSHLKEYLDEERKEIKAMNERRKKRENVMLRLEKLL